MNFWPHKMTDESAPIEPGDPSTTPGEKWPSPPTSFAEERRRRFKAQQTAVQVDRVPDPEPDLSTKPKDIVGYCFGYACPKKHVFDFFDSITLDQYNVRKPCPECGGVSRPAIVKKVSEARRLNWDSSSSWGLPPSPNWKWEHRNRVPGFFPAAFNWTSYEFVHYLDPVKPRPRRRKK